MTTGWNVGWKSGWGVGGTNTTLLQGFDSSGPLHATLMVVFNVYRPRAGTTKPSTVITSNQGNVWTLISSVTSNQGGALQPLTIDTYTCFIGVGQLFSFESTYSVAIDGGIGMWGAQRLTDDTQFSASNFTGSVRQVNGSFSDVPVILDPAFTPNSERTTVLSTGGGFELQWKSADADSVVIACSANNDFVFADVSGDLTSVGTIGSWAGHANAAVLLNTAVAAGNDPQGTWNHGFGTPSGNILTVVELTVPIATSSFTPTKHAKPVFVKGLPHRTGTRMVGG